MLSAVFCGRLSASPGRSEVSILAAADARPDGHEGIEILVSFPLDKATILPAFRANAVALARLDSLMNEGIHSPADTLEIIGKASMDGPERHNLDLARRRAEALRNYIVVHYPLYPGVVTIKVEGEPWGELREAVERDAALTPLKRTQLLSIIDSDDPADRKEARLKAFAAWAAFNRQLFPDYRGASVQFFPAPLFDNAFLEEIAAISPYIHFPETAVELRPDVLTVPALTRPRVLRPVLALSTNLLYDLTYIPGYGLTSIPSLSLEYYPRNYGRFSFGADVEWPMWRHWDEHRFFQIQNVTLNARWYFVRNYQHNFRGPYVLANVNGVRYGIGFDADTGWEGEGIGASAGIGYKHSLFGSKRLFWDTGIALGFFYSRYDPYVWGNDPTKRYYYDYDGLPENFVKRNHALEWVGPTRIWFSIGVDLFNRKSFVR